MKASQGSLNIHNKYLKFHFIRLLLDSFEKSQQNEC